MILRYTVVYEHDRDGWRGYIPDIHDCSVADKDLAAVADGLRDQVASRFSSTDGGVPPAPRPATSITDAMTVWIARLTEAGDDASERALWFSVIEVTLPDEGRTGRRLDRWRTHLGAWWTAHRYGAPLVSTASILSATLSWLLARAVSGDAPSGLGVAAIIAAALCAAVIASRLASALQIVPRCLVYLRWPLIGGLVMHLGISGLALVGWHLLDAVPQGDSWAALKLPVLILILALWAGSFGHGVAGWARELHAIHTANRLRG